MSEVVQESGEYLSPGKIIRGLDEGRAIWFDMKGAGWNASPSTCSRVFATHRTTQRNVL